MSCLMTRIDPIARVEIERGLVRDWAAGEALATHKEGKAPVQRIKTPRILILDYGRYLYMIRPEEGEI